MKVEAILCTDGSSTLFVPEMNETYHSRHGAITESRHVYIEAGLARIEKRVVNILEFGFGTGLNALLSLQYAREHKVSIRYTSCELYPLESRVWQQLNYGELLEMQEEWKNIHEAEWNRELPLYEDFSLLKFKGDFRDTPLAPGSFDVVFYDAFAPSKQPEVWAEDYLKKASSALSADGILVSYCAQGQFKRNLKMLGFEVETIPGPPGKMEMVRAGRHD